jgi:antitoxin component of RelBE/YafQ-DinJ toxin-antitoxin module
MEIQITVNENVGRLAAEKAEAMGISLERAIAAYLQRVAEGTEPIEDELLLDGTPMRRALRQQIYRLGA